MVSSELEGVYATSHLQQLVTNLSKDLRQYLLQPTNDTYTKIEQEQQKIKESFTLINNLVNSDEVHTMIKDVSNEYALLTTTINNIQTIVTNNNSISTAQYIASLDAQSNKIIASTDEILTVVKERFKAVSLETNATVSNILILLIAFTAISIGFAIFITLKFNRNIVLPMKVLSKNAAQIANGDLTVPPIETKSKDEIGTLIHAFNNMKHSLNDIINVCNANTLDLSAMSEQLTASTNVVSQSSSAVAQNMDEMSVSLATVVTISEQSTSAMKETALSATEIMKSTTTIHQQASATSSLTVDAEKNIAIVRNQMELIKNSSDETSLLIQKLILQSKQIQAITNVITEITDQTNLLALNAAIEAARAGEHGKGFAVVADEVRKLAEQSKQSANEIVSLVTNILVESEHVERSVKLSNATVSEGVQMIDQSSSMFIQIFDTFQMITDNIAEISTMSTQISSSTNQVAVSSAELSTNIQSVASNSSNVSQQVEEQTATIQEIHAISENLSARSLELASAISRFKTA